MTFSEFKAWLNGFSHSIQNAPTKERWEIIKKQLELVVIDFHVDYPKTFTLPTLMQPATILPEIN